VVRNQKHIARKTGEQRETFIWGHVYWAFTTVAVYNPPAFLYMKWLKEWGSFGQSGIKLILGLTVNKKTDDELFQIKERKRDTKSSYLST
jgi:hypothetical protein